MKALYARALTDQERKTLQVGLKSSDGFKVRRCQMILLSADEQLKVAEIGRRLGCQGQAVREVSRSRKESPKGGSCASLVKG